LSAITVQSVLLGEMSISVSPKRILTSGMLNTMVAVATTSTVAIIKEKVFDSNVFFDFIFSVLLTFL
jgi:hypothetical protein